VGGEGNVYDDEEREREREKKKRKKSLKKTVVFLCSSQTVVLHMCFTCVRVRALLSFFLSFFLSLLSLVVSLLTSTHRTRKCVGNR
jgi:pheromone shutdown protein TraB